MNDNVRTLNFTGDDTPLMPEDVFEGDGAADFTEDELAAAVPQFTEGEVIEGGFTATPPPLTSASLHKPVFIFVEIPSLGIEAPLDVDTAVSLFDTLGAAINEL